jgi:membrane-bound ClpP family serine protease
MWVRDLTIVTIICAAIFAGFMIYMVYATIKGRKRKLSAGAEAMIGKVAITQSVLNPKGTVLAEGEIWKAIADGSIIEPDEEVIITKIEGLKLWVTKKSKEKEDK